MFRISPCPLKLFIDVNGRACVCDGSVVDYQDSAVGFKVAYSDTGFKDIHTEMSKTKCEYVPAPEFVCVSDKIAKGKSGGNIFQTRIMVLDIKAGEHHLDLDRDWFLDGAKGIQKRYIASVDVVSNAGSFVQLGKLKVERVGDRPVFVSAIKKVDEQFLLSSDSPFRVTCRSTILIKRPVVTIDGRTKRRKKILQMADSAGNSLSSAEVV